MNRPLRICVADDEVDMRDYFRTILPRLGHEVVAVTENGAELLAACQQQSPDLVITDIKMPDVDGITAAERLYEMRPVPVILVSAFHDPELIARAEQDHILAYLVKPIKQADLETAIAIATRRFGQFQALLQETQNLRQALEDRKVIERAKGVLMRRGGLDEAAAFKRLQQLSNTHNRKMVEIASSILLGVAAIDGEEQAASS